ncbi:MAG: 3-oxoacyl-[acyl-carrier-protein] reductase [Syntrophales bacterium]
MSLSGKTALITGGSRGIGRASAVKLAGEGAFVYINYLQNESAALDTLLAIRKKGGEGKIIPFDVSNFEATRASVRDMVKEKGGIDILVNNAGISLDGLMVRMKEEDWDCLINTNLKGVFNCCQAVTRYMMKQRWGRIVNITSVVAEAGNAGQVAYSASKAGIIGLSKSLARELGGRNICVNAVSPGFIETDMTAFLSNKEQHNVRNQIPLARLGTPEDVAGVVAFLVSDEANYITGQVIRVNGGLYM